MITEGAIGILRVSPVIVSCGVSQQHGRDTKRSRVGIENLGLDFLRCKQVLSWILAPQLGRFDQAIQYIQEYTGFISPGVCVIFLLGFFWPRATGAAALAVALATIPLSAGFKYLTPGMPFLNRMGYVTLILTVCMVLISLAAPQPGDEVKAMRWDREDFRPGGAFIAGSVLIMGVLAALYAVYW